MSLQIRMIAVCLEAQCVLSDALLPGQPEDTPPDKD